MMVILVVFTRDIRSSKQEAESFCMKSIQIDRYGSVEVLQYNEAERPSPGPGEVLIRAQASSVNPFDCAVRAGYLTGWYPYNFPLILGLDVAGVVEACGAGVTQFAPGDAVYARTDPSRNGAYAEYVLARPEEMAARPKSVDAQHAAAMPHVALTAWTLVETANLSPGQTVLIHAAAGGVGHMAVQFARQRGARVIGTASEHNLGFLAELGVDEAINYTVTPFESVAREVDAVLDTVGYDTLERSWGVLKPGGILLSIVQPPSQESADAHGVRQQFVGAGQPGGDLLSKFAAMLDAGQLKVTVSTVLPLSEIQRAHTLVEGRHVRGKLALDIGM
jgi:NADPH:quinone reductase-like Zn-dependent oxidoreductase